MCLPVSALPQPKRVPQDLGDIYQLVEKREGRVSCLGITIQLRHMRFGNVSSNQIMIREAKHGYDLKEMMTWSVDQKGKRLVIRFKPGQGDFGSGNAVEVLIDRSAFLGRIPSKSNHFRWSIDTDVL